MSNWKNPNEQNSEHPSSSLWNNPQVNLSTEEKIGEGVLLVIKGLFGFILLVSINALALFLFLNIMDMDRTYSQCVLGACVYVCWRVYDKTVFSKLKKD
jgi:hypothetical protein